MQLWYRIGAEPLPGAIEMPPAQLPALAPLRPVLIGPVHVFPAQR